jgi:hypothetical protein
MSDIREMRNVLVKRTLGAGKAPSSDRRAAFNNCGLVEPPGLLVDKVARHAYLAMDDDISAAKASGSSEDQIFELAVCAAIGQAISFCRSVQQSGCAKSGVVRSTDTARY